MVHPINLAGHRFGNLTVIAPIPAKPRRKWQCLCDCGSTSVLDTGKLRSGNTTSCGCNNPFARKHGVSGTPLEAKYADMKRRCDNQKCGNYRWYGGRGIKVCQQWRVNPSAFYAWAFSNGYQPGLEIDRIDSDGDYTPENCRFVTHLENMRNQRRVKESLSARARTAGILPPTLFSRLRRGWSVDAALSHSLQPRAGGNHASA